MKFTVRTLFSLFDFISLLFFCVIITLSHVAASSPVPEGGISLAVGPSGSRFNPGARVGGCSNSTTDLPTSELLQDSILVLSTPYGPARAGPPETAACTPAGGRGGCESRQHQRGRPPPFLRKSKTPTAMVQHHGTWKWMVIDPQTKKDTLSPGRR